MAFIEETLAQIVAIGIALRRDIAELREELERRNSPSELLDLPTLAALLGCSTRALRARLRRGSELGSVALEIDGRKVWRRSDVDAFLARGRRPPLRSLGGRGQ
jgi:hypothetical protein